MEVDHNLLEYGKSMLFNIKRGADIYKSKLVEEKERFDSYVVILLKTLTQIKENFIFRTAQLKQKYLEINNRIEFIQKQNMRNIIDTANEINSYFCSVNKEFTDFLSQTKNKIKNEIIQEAQKLFSLEFNNMQIIPRNNPSQHENDYKIINKREIVNNMIPSNGINIPNVNFNTHSALNLNPKPNFNNEANFNKNKQNEKNNIQILPYKSNWVDRGLQKSNSNFYEKKDSLITSNKTENYGNVNENRHPSFQNNFPNKEKNENNLQVKKTFDNDTCNNLDNSQYWNQSDINSVKNNGQVDPSISEATKYRNAFDDCDTPKINKSEENHSEKLLSKKRFKHSKTDKLDYKFKKIISDKFNKNNESQFFDEDRSLTYSPVAKSITKADLEILNTLQNKFPDMGIDFTTMLDYLKNKVIHCFEFNLMNNQTVLKQVDNYLNNHLIAQDHSTLIKLTISSDECDARSPVYHHLIELFEQRCGAFVKNEMYIGGVCKSSLRDLFNKISSDSYLKCHKIKNVRISLYYFFEDILNDLEEIKPTCKTSNLSKKDENEKNHFRMIIKKFRSEYEKIAK